MLRNIKTQFLPSRQQLIQELLYTERTYIRLDFSVTTEPSAIITEVSVSSNSHSCSVSGGEEIAMSTEEASTKNSQPQLVKLGKALKLAEQWVNSMSKSLTDGKSTAIELESRPARLGIGATVPRGHRVANSSDPVERKLLAKLDAEKRKAVKRAEEFAPSSKDGNVDEDSEDELESKTEAFAKKRPLNTMSSLQQKKKHK